ncbi:MAG TPA: hypothetical protein VHB21_25030 [Minicystis sp.]|nr:hypothetical protein [Minicystis sp.]
MNRGVVAFLTCVLSASACGSTRDELPPSFPPAPPAASPLGDRALVRVEPKGPVWVILAGERHHVPDRRTLASLGFRYHDIQLLPAERVEAVPEGFAFESDGAVQREVPELLSKLPDRTLVRAQGDPQVYMILLGERHRVRRRATLVALGVDPDRVRDVTLEQLVNIPEGPEW